MVRSARRLAGDRLLRSPDRSSSPERVDRTGNREIHAGNTLETYVDDLSTVVDAHEILVMEAGRIIERGTHAQLLAMDGRYAQMWSLQQQSTADQ